jgi:hydrogenase-4 component B
VVPSNIAALMSASGKDGHLRIDPDLHGRWAGARVVGISLICIGAVSAILGILYSLVENDEAVLAYSSVENIGIILLSARP